MTTTFKSIPDAFDRRVSDTPDRVAFRYPDGGAWHSVTWREAGERVRDIAAGLRELGLTDEARCAILSGTRYEWVLVDVAVLCAGGATTTIYPSSTPDECAFILGDSESYAVFAESDEQVTKLASKRAGLPKLAHVIVMDGRAGDGVMTLAQVEELGRARRKKLPDELGAITQKIGPQSLATLIYTSGTTGRPKGVELTHDNWIFEGEAIQALGLLTPQDEHYLWLPLAHSFGKVLQMAQLIIGFPTAIDGRVDKIVDNLAALRPTFVAAVPRIFEKVHAKVVLGARAGSPLKQRIFDWAIGVGRKVSELERDGRRAGLALGLQHRVADRLVFSKLRERFGGRLRFFVSGSAPLGRELAEFFHAAGILILEGYGLTESSAATFVNRPQQYRFGTVGLPVPGAQVKLAEDGEILLGGRGIMRGYHGLPDETRETLQDGWLKTGDIGVIDEQGFLKITDRKKDLIKTSGGKYVAPQMIESMLKTSCPYISQVLVHGNGRNFCSALVTLEPEALKSWAAANGKSGDYAHLTQDPDMRRIVDAALQGVNAQLPSYSSIKKIAVLQSDFSQETGELTPSMKVKRKVIEEKYKKTLDAMYEGGKG